MAIYRGTGSASTTTDQATIDEVTTQATNAANSATSAASSASSAASSASSASSSASTATTQASAASSSATSAASSASAASTSASSASTSATNAAASATTAASEATNAETAETGAVAARSAAEGAQTAAEAAQALAEAAQSDASASAASASASASTATTKASEASTSATSASTSASQSATSATQAAASAASAASAFDSFDDRYLGAKASDPATDNDGSTLIVGALYFNTTDGVMRIYTASGWINASSSSVATMQKYKFTATSGQTVFSGTDDDAETLSITVGAELVTLNGVVLEVGTDYTVTSSSITLTSGATTSDELNVYAFGNFLVADTVSASTGGTFQAEVTFDGGAAFNDNDKATFGDGDDLQIYHNGTNSYIDDSGTGDLYVRASDDLRLQVRNDTDTAWASSVICNDGGETSLHYNGTKKIATTNTGIDVTGTVTADGLTVDNAVATITNNDIDNGATLRLDNAASGSAWGSGKVIGTLEYYLSADASTTEPVRAKIELEQSSAATTYPSEGNLSFYTTSQNTLSKNMTIASNGDISFYEDTGTTAKFFWDASAESLGIGTTSPMLNSDGILGLEIKGATPGLTIANSTGGHIYSTWVDTSDNYILQDNTNNASRIVVSSAGNVGIGTTPDSGWSNSWNALQIGNDASLSSTRPSQSFGRTFLTSNAYNSGGNQATTWNYQGSFHATQYTMQDGNHIWRYAPSGTADAAITWSEAMRIDSSGNVGIGTTTVGQFASTDVGLTVDSGNAYSGIACTDGATTSTLAQGYSTTYLYNQANGSMLFGTNNTERMRIDSIGNAGIGLTPPSWNTGFGPALHVGAGAALWSRSDLRASLGSNWYVGTSGGAATSFRIGTGQASQYLQLQGQHLFYIAGSDSAGTVISGTQAMTLDNNGNLLVGETSASTAPSTSGGTENLQWVKVSGRPELLVQSDRSNGVAKINVTFNDTSTRDAVRFYRTGTQVGSISCSTTATAYNTSSDYRLKENVVDMTGAIDRVKALNPSQFNFIADPDTIVDGFLAHEVADVVPEAVTGTKDAVDADGNPEYQGIDQSKLVPLLTGALQEAIARIETLEAEVATLKGN